MRMRVSESSLIRHGIGNIRVFRCMMSIFTELTDSLMFYTRGNGTIVNDVAEIQRKGYGCQDPRILRNDLRQSDIFYSHAGIVSGFDFSLPRPRLIPIAQSEKN